MHQNPALFVIMVVAVVLLVLSGCVLCCRPTSRQCVLTQTAAVKPRIVSVSGSSVVYEAVPAQEKQSL